MAKLSVQEVKNFKIMMHELKEELTAAAILRNDDIDLSSDEDLANDALEQLIKSKEEAEIFNDLPLFDVTIIHNCIDEWFDTPNISFEDLQLPIGLSVAFHCFRASPRSAHRRTEAKD